MRQNFFSSCAAGLPFLLPFALVPGALVAGPAQPLHAAASLSDPAPAKITLKTADEQTLSATYFAPIDTKQKAPGALLIHDTGGSRADLQPLALRLQKSGFAVLSLDLRGHGESATNEFNWKQLDSDGQLRAWNAMPGDVKAGVNFLATHEGVMPAQVSLIAHASGAGLIARHSVRDERICDLVLIDPKTEAFKDSLVKDLQQLGGLPTLVIVGKGEENAGKRLSEASGRATGAVTWMDIKASKLATSEMLTDKAMYGDISRWIVEKALPKQPKN